MTIGAIFFRATQATFVFFTTRLEFSSKDDKSSHTASSRRSCVLLVLTAGRRSDTAAAKSVRDIDPEIEVDEVANRFRPKVAIGDVVFCCVDSIETRVAIWRLVGNRTAFFADGRMLTETIFVLVFADAASCRHYPLTILRE